MNWLERYPWATAAERDPDGFFARPRVEWGDGPWQDEPDRLRWLTVAGYPGAIWRSPHTGSLCGYAAVPEGHPYHGKPWRDLELATDPHGGLTFSGRLEPLETVWWLGFDCNHFRDLSPVLEATLRDLRHPRHWPRYAAQGRGVPPPFEGFGDIYRDVPYVRGEVEDLARELVAAASGQAMLHEALSGERIPE